MFFNFALAHLFRSISTFWFYLGTLVAAAARRSALRRVSTRRSRRAITPVDRASRRDARAARVQPHPAGAAREEADAHRARRAGGRAGYVAQRSSRRAGASGARRRRSFIAAAGERVYCFTSVFVPNGSARRSATAGSSTTSGRRTADVPPVPASQEDAKADTAAIRTRQNVIPGRWRVTAESESGAAIGMPRRPRGAGSMGGGRPPPDEAAARCPPC